MKSILFWTGIAFVAFISACVQFKPATFYSGEVQVAPPTKPERISLEVEPIILKDVNKDVWGLEKNECQEVTLSTNVVHAGATAIKLVWNRNAEGCVWAGIGIGWDGWAGKDLTSIMDYAAISMYVRTVEGKAFGLPFVLTLEDYSGGMGFCYTANKYFERTTLDEEWQNVMVPLRDFDLETEKLDVSNIKQLQIELQQSGAVYLDNIELVYFTPERQKPWMKEDKLPDPIDLPITLFDDKFINNNGWGMITDRCQAFAIENDESADKGRSIHAKWDATAGGCELMAFGVSWNKWHPVDVRSILNNAVIQFDIKLITADAAGNLSIKVGFEDYDRAKSEITLQNAYSASGRYLPEWGTVQIPLKDLPQTIDFTRVKQLYFSFDGKGELYLDNLQLLPVKSS